MTEVYAYNRQARPSDSPMKFIFLILAMAPLSATSAPACIKSAAKNVVILNYGPNHGGQVVLQRIETIERIYMKRCSGKERDNCFYATDVPPGKYFFREVATPNFRFVQSISVKEQWFEIVARGVNYAGDWQVASGDSISVKGVMTKYNVQNMDKIIKTCRLTDHRVYLSKVRTPAMEIVD